MAIEKKSETLLKVRGVDDETKERLQALAHARYGKANASQYIRDLIDEALRREVVDKTPPDLTSEMRRFQITIPMDCYDRMCQKAEARFSSPQFYVAGLIYKDLGVPQLHVDQVEVLRNSNYNLAKIGSNVNQIARAFNQLVLHYQGKDKLPAIGREMDKLKKIISDHTEKVLNVLNQGTVMMETRGRGSGNAKREATLSKKPLGKNGRVIVKKR